MSTNIWKLKIVASYQLPHHNPGEAHQIQWDVGTLTPSDIKDYHWLLLTINISSPTKTLRAPLLTTQRKSRETRFCKDRALRLTRSHELLINSLALVCINEMLRCDHSLESYWAVLSCGSLLRRGLFVLWGGWGERKRERAGHDGFPLSIVPRALSIFSIIDILMGIPSGSLCGGESSCGAVYNAVQVDSNF